MESKQSSPAKPKRETVLMTTHKAITHAMKGEINVQIEQIAELRALAERVSRLNPTAGEIGAGMLAQLVDEANRLLKK